MNSISPGECPQVFLADSITINRLRPTLSNQLIYSHGCKSLKYFIVIFIFQGYCLTEQQNMGVGQVKTLKNSLFLLKFILFIE